MRGEQEITLDDALVGKLAVTGPGDPVQPSTELTVRVHAASMDDLDQGASRCTSPGCRARPGQSPAGSWACSTPATASGCARVRGPARGPPRTRCSRRSRRPAVCEVGERRARPAGGRAAHLARRAPRRRLQARFPSRTWRSRRTPPPAPGVALPPPAGAHDPAQRGRPGIPLPTRWHGSCWRPRSRWPPRAPRSTGGPRPRCRSCPRCATGGRSCPRPAGCSPTADLPGPEAALAGMGRCPCRLARARPPARAGLSGRRRPVRRPGPGRAVPPGAAARRPRARRQGQAARRARPGRTWAGPAGARTRSPSRWPRPARPPTRCGGAARSPAGATATCPAATGGSTSSSTVPATCRTPSSPAICRPWPASSATRPWWFMRYNDPEEHLRLRLATLPAGIGNAAGQVGAWTRAAPARGASHARELGHLLPGDRAVRRHHGDGQRPKSSSPRTQARSWRNWRRAPGRTAWTGGP